MIFAGIAKKDRVPRSLARLFGSADQFRIKRIRDIRDDEPDSIGSTCLQTPRDSIRVVIERGHGLLNASAALGADYNSLINYSGNGRGGDASQTCHIFHGELYA